MTNHQFECRCVSKVYDGRKVLDAVSFTLRAGEHTAILGPSGSGKSTVLRLLAGLEAPSAGQVLLDGNVVSAPRRIVKAPHMRGIAMVFQDLALWPNLTVIDNVLLGLSGSRLAKRAMKERAREALARCAIEALAQRKPGNISGGEQQRVALARALAVQPTYLLLDEPFSGLDLVTKTQLLADLTDLTLAQHLTLVLVTHDPTEATTLCRSAIVLQDGRVEAAGLFAELLQASQSEVLRLFRAHLPHAAAPVS